MLGFNMDDYSKKRIKNLVVYSLCGLSMVSVYGVSVNIARESPYHTPIFITGCVLSYGVPHLIRSIFIKDDNEDEM